MPVRKKPLASPEETADEVAKGFFRVGSDPASEKAAVRQFLVGAVECAVLIPLLFYWRFGEVTSLGWGTTVFFITFCLLAAVGLYFRSRSEYHTTVRLRGDWIDYVGAFWLVACAFGPLLGWFVTAAFPLTLGSWRGLYSVRVVLAAGLPLLTALALTRYVRGKAAWVALPLLVLVTLLPVWTAVNPSRDLQAGPAVRHGQSVDGSTFYLKYTERSLNTIP